MRTAFVALLFASAAACSHAQPAPPVNATADAALAPAAAPAPAPAAFVAPSGDALARAREAQIARLEAYRQRAVFPLDAAGMPLAAFRDAQGRPCPMAALIEQSGHKDLVDDVVRTNNTLQLASVHDGPLMDWMLASGLTQEEVAMVQGALDWSNSMDDYGQPVMAHRQNRARAIVTARLQEAVYLLRQNSIASLATAVERAHAAESLARAKPRAAVAANPYE